MYLGNVVSDRLCVSFDATSLAESSLGQGGQGTGTSGPGCLYRTTSRCFARNGLRTTSTPDFPGMNQSFCLCYLSQWTSRQDVFPKVARPFSLRLRTARSCSHSLPPPPLPYRSRVNTWDAACTITTIRNKCSPYLRPRTMASGFSH